MPGFGGCWLRWCAVTDHDIAGLEFGPAKRLAQLRAGASQLSQALSRAELQPGDIVIRDGAPPQPAPAKAGHFLDRAL